VPGEVLCEAALARARAEESGHQIISTGFFTAR
jgi:hypothetical protein